MLTTMFILQLWVAGLLLTCSFSFLLQGLYVFVVYFILHNQTCCPMKASYTVEMNGHPGPSTAFFTPGSGMPPSGGEISKSTQNLISAMEEVLPLTLTWPLSVCFFPIYSLSISKSVQVKWCYVTFKSLSYMLANYSIMHVIQFIFFLALQPTLTSGLF